VRRSAWVAVVAAVGLGLTGCSDPGTPSDTLPTAVSTSASPTLEPLGPADFPVPADAREQTEAGAVAAAEYYFGLLNYTQAIPTGQPLREFSDGCADCESIAASQDQDAVDGVAIQGGQFTVASAAAEIVESGSANVAVRIDRDASAAVSAGGTSIEGRSGPAATLSGGVLLRWDGVRDVWVVTQIDLDAV